MCSRVHQSADPFVLRNLIEKPDALPSQEAWRENNMPAIIDAADHQRWFDGADDLLVPYPADKMSLIPVE